MNDLPRQEAATDGAAPEQLDDVIIALWRECGADPEAGTFTAGGGTSLSALRLLTAVYQATGKQPTWEDLDNAENARAFAERVRARASAVQ